MHRFWKSDAGVIRILYTQMPEIEKYKISKRRQRRQGSDPCPRPVRFLTDPDHLSVITKSIYSKLPDCQKMLYNGFTVISE